MSVIAICGNHQVPYCTESELAWTFEDMGHQVVRLQENMATTDIMLEESLRMGAQLFLYIHTHGWHVQGTFSMGDLIIKLRDAGIKTASFHLDRYWGLNQGDKREDRIGVHPFWHSDMVFTADGGNQERFTAKGINHTWLPPAVAKRHCWRGVADQKFAVDIAFVGAKNYHPEYPFRGQLIEWLGRTYGDRFRRFGGDTPSGVVREAPLNNLYASVKIVVGDSCFAGADRYWSDRVPETLGRGGFLIHPHTPGLEMHQGVVTFQPGNITELHSMIERYLEAPNWRREYAAVAMADTLAHHTYHNRMQTVLEVMGL